MMPEPPTIQKGDRIRHGRKLFVVLSAEAANRAGGYFQVRKATWLERLRWWWSD
jgi:hypothetical protein